MDISHLFIVITLKPLFLISYYPIVSESQVSYEEMLESELREKRLSESNLNPFTFKYCVDNNMLGCRKWLSPYDYEWYGKYR